MHDREKLIEMLVKQRGERGVELAARLGQDLGPGFLGRPRFLVAALADQSVEYVGNGHTGGVAVDLVALQPD